MIGAGFRALDNRQAEFPPPAPEGGADGLGGLTTRQLRYALRGVSGRILGGRSAACGQRAFHGTVGIKRGATGAFFCGLVTCGSVWTCPVCAARIGEVRRRDIAAVLDGVEREGGAPYMVALTIPHHAFQRCGELREAVSLAWRKLTAGAPWQRMRERYGMTGYIRALEITHGANGWHPHLHVLLVLDHALDDVEEFELGEWLFRRWQRIVARLGFGECSFEAFRFERVARREAAGEYVGKWGADSELAAPGNKSGRRVGSRSPWQLLRDSYAGDRRAVRLFRHYADAMKGARQLTWSMGLRERYRLAPELSDDEAAASEPEAPEEIGVISRQAWKRVSRRRLSAVLLDCAERGGWPAVLDFLKSEGIDPDEPAPGEKSRADRIRSFLERCEECKSAHGAGDGVGRAAGAPKSH